MMIDAGAVFKMQNSIIDVGTSAQGINRAAGNTPKKTRLTQTSDIFVRLHIRLRYDTDLVARFDEHPPDHRHADKRTVDIAVAGHEDDIKP